ncbi:MAG: ferredoxin--NADP reductase [Fibrobacterales bacterium]
MAAKDELNGIVTQVTQVSPIMKVIRIAPDGWELPDFVAGQFCALFLPPDATRCPEATEEPYPNKPDKMIKRAYSIASGSKTKEYLEFYITLIHSGNLTPRMFSLNVGDRIGVGKKFTGMFTLDQLEGDKNIVLVATGTGVAPYMSMLRSDALKKNHKICVVHGASNSWDLGYSSELRLLESLHDQFSYIPTILFPDKEPVPWGGMAKFVQDIYKDGDVQKAMGQEITPDNTHVFLCGNPSMINDMIEILEGEGFNEHKKRAPGNIHSEKF